jgi:DNA-binding CsgD family transcriptional regulator
MPSLNDQFIDRIYAAAVITDLWPSLLDEVALYGASAGAALLTRTHRGWLGWLLSNGLADPSFLREATPSQSAPHVNVATGFVADHVLFPDERDYQSHPYVARYAAPNGLYRSATTLVALPGGATAVVMLMRGAGAPAFSDAEIGQLDALRPHLARAAMLAARWARETLRTAVQALEILGLPAAVVGADGRMLLANGRFEQLKGHIRWLARDRFAFVDPRAARALATGLERAEGLAAGGISIALRGDAARRPAIAHLLPVCGEARDLFTGGLSLLVIDELGQGELDAALVQRFFDFTPAEAEVAAQLLQGRSVDEIADHRGVGRDTVRAQIKAVLAKSGVRRQAEFVARFGGQRLHPRGDASDR